MRFLLKLNFYVQEYQGKIKVIAFCILPNHFHFVLFEPEFKAGLGGREKSQIPEFMHRLQTSYAMYFSIKYKDLIKPGLKMPVFEGRYRSKVIIKEKYLISVVNYVEYNAVRHEIVDSVYDWPYSSFDCEKPEESMSMEDVFDEFEFYF